MSLEKMTSCWSWFPAGHKDPCIVTHSTPQLCCFGPKDILRDFIRITWRFVCTVNKDNLPQANKTFECMRAVTLRLHYHAPSGALKSSNPEKVLERKRQRNHRNSLQLRRGRHWCWLKSSGPRAVDCKHSEQHTWEWITMEYIWKYFFPWWSK